MWRAAGEPFLARLSPRLGIELGGSEVRPGLGEEADHREGLGCGAAIPAGGPGLGAGAGGSSMRSLAAAATPRLQLERLLLLLLLCPASLSLPVPTSAIQVRVTAARPLARPLQASLPPRLWLRAGGAGAGRRAGSGETAKTALRAAAPRPRRQRTRRAHLPHPLSALRASGRPAARLWKQELEGKTLASL